MAADFFLVIPAYREARRLPLFLRELGRVLSSAPFTTEILIVDDGSPRKEQQELHDQLNIGTFGSCRILEPLLLPQNGGKGRAIIEGWRRAQETAWLAFVDADGGTPAREVLRLFDLAARTGDDPPPCYWGSRVRMLGRRTDRSQLRYLTGRAFANLVSGLIRVPVYDCQCGFKLVPAIHYQRIAPLLREPRYCFDVELLLALRHAAAPVLEVPVDWTDVPGSHVRLFRDGPAMIARVLSIRRRARNWPRVI